MKRINKKDDLKFNYSLLNSEGVLAKPETNLKFIFYTSILKKKIATVNYKKITNPINQQVTKEYNCTNCYFQDLEYTNLVTNTKQIGPVLVIYFNEPKFKSGKLHCKLYLDTPDETFKNSDSKYKKVKKIDTNIEII